MNLLFLGDLMGRPGRTAVIEALPGLRERLKLDFVVVNTDNAASGFGLTGRIADELFAAGADCLTIGDHGFDQKGMLTHIEGEPRILRPLNYGKGAPGAGARVFEATRGRKVLVAHALGRVFMPQYYEDPFSVLEAAVRKHPLGSVDAAIIDIHAEATSEKMAIGHYFDGRASLVVGTHTHVPTGDAMILNRGTAYLSDAGMCGGYDSVIGMDKAEPLRRFITGMRGPRFSPAEGGVTICGVFVRTEARTGRAVHVSPLRTGGRLAPIMPEPDAA